MKEKETAWRNSMCNGWSEYEVLGGGQLGGQERRF